MAHHRNFRIEHATHQIHTLAPAFKLYRFGSAFFHEPCGVAHAFLHVTLIGAKRHVSDDQRRFHSPAHSAGVMQHFFHGDRKRAVIAQHHLGERIAHQDHVYAGFINQTRCGVVVGSQAGDKFMPLLFLLDGESGDFRSGARNSAALR